MDSSEKYNQVSMKLVFTCGFAEATEQVWQYDPLLGKPSPYEPTAL
jgi:hypothetical protein